MLKIRDIKAYARESLLHKYGTVIGAYFLSGLMIIISAALTILSIGLALANTRRFEGQVKSFAPGFKAVPALSVIFAVLFIVLLIFTVVFAFLLDIGRKKLIINICRGDEYRAGDIFYGFRRGSHPFTVIVVRVVTWILVRINIIFPQIAVLCARAQGYKYLDNKIDFHEPWSVIIFAVNIITVFWMLWLALGFTFSETIIIDKPSERIMDSVRGSLSLMKKNRLRFLWLVITFIFWALLTSLVPAASLWVLPYIEASIVIFYLCAGGEAEVNPAYADALSGAQEEAAEEPAENVQPAEETVMGSADENIQPEKEESSDAAETAEPIEDVQEPAMEEQSNEMPIL